MEGCPRSTELMAALDGRLDDAATEHALRHANACASCRAARVDHAALRGLARGLPGYTADPLSARRVRAAVMRSSLTTEPTGVRPVYLAVALALVVLVMLTATVGWRLIRGGAPTDAIAAGVALAGAGTMSPMPGAVVAVRRAGHDTRIELASGEVSFAVEHRLVGERFVVATADAEVEVRGTRFRLTARGGLLRRVEVTQGVVVVRRPPDAEQRVTAGMTLDLPVQAPTATPEEPVVPALPAPSLAPSLEPPPGPSLEPVVAGPVHPRSVPRRTEDATARDFREGALDYVRGDNAQAAAALQRFLDASPASDIRREDARYVLVLSLTRAGRGADAESAALAYLREFPRGLRRPEVAMQLALSAARRGDCDRASTAALALPEDVDARVRGAVAQALAACHAR